MSKTETKLKSMSDSDMPPAMLRKLKARANENLYGALEDGRFYDAYTSINVLNEEDFKEGLDAFSEYGSPGEPCYQSLVMMKKNYNNLKKIPDIPDKDKWPSQYNSIGSAALFITIGLLVVLYLAYLVLSFSFIFDPGFYVNNFKMIKAVICAVILGFVLLYTWSSVSFNSTWGAVTNLYFAIEPHPRFERYKDIYEDAQEFIKEDSMGWLFLAIVLLLYHCKALLLLAAGHFIH